MPKQKSVIRKMKIDFFYKFILFYLLISICFVNRDGGCEIYEDEFIRIMKKKEIFL